MAFDMYKIYPIVGFSDQVFSIKYINKLIINLVSYIYNIIICSSKESSRRMLLNLFVFFIGNNLNFKIYYLTVHFVNMFSINIISLLFVINTS